MKNLQGQCLASDAEHLQSLRMHLLKGTHQTHCFKMAQYQYLLRPYVEPNPESYQAVVQGILAEEMEVEDQRISERKPSNIKEFR